MRSLPPVLAPLLVLWFATAPAQAGEEVTVRRFLLVAGVNDGGPGRVVLRYAEHDAERFAEVMHAHGGIDPADTVVLHGADVDAMRAAFGALEAKLGAAGSVARREVVFYYSGHSDELGLLMHDERLPYRELRQSIDALSADVRIIVLDSCSAGALTRTKGGARRAPFLVDEASQVTGHAYLTSSSEDEVAQESDRIGGSFFTHFLVTGLRGAADVSGDRKVTLSEAYQFAFEETLARTESTRSGPQHPVYEIQLTGTGDLVLTDLRSTEATLQLATSLAGRLYVHQAGTNALVAELAKVGGRELALHLPPGRYSVVLEDAQASLWQVNLDLIAGGISALEMSALVAIERESTVARGGPVILDDGTGAPPDAAAAAAPYDELPFHIGLVPWVGTNDYLTTGGPVRNLVSLHLLVGGTDAVDGLMAAGLVGWVPDSVRGFQGSGLVSAAGGVDGFQASGLVGVAEQVSGAQASGLVSVARELGGAQLALVNVGGSVDGAQIGLVNVAGELSGTQIGLVNVAGAGGVPLGLVNYASEDGILAPVVYASETAALNAGLRIGASAIYTQLSVGTRLLPTDGHDWAGELGLALGGRIRVTESFWLDLDLQHSHFVTEDGIHPESLLERARLAAHVRFAPNFGIFAGASFNVLVELLRDPVPLGQTLPGIVVVERTAIDDVEVRMFPGLFGGLEF